MLKDLSLYEVNNNQDILHFHNVLLHDDNISVASSLRFAPQIRIAALKLEALRIHSF